MKKIAFVFMALMLMACTCFAGVFKNFQEEKNYCVNIAFEKVREIGEEPVLWYSDLSTFTKSNAYTAATVVVKCKGNKMAYCWVQYKIVKDWFSDNEDIRMLQNSATIKHSTL